MKEAADIRLSIVNDPDAKGDHWRILNLNGGTLPFKNPHAKKGQTISWQSPGDDIEAWIVPLGESPLKGFEAGKAKEIKKGETLGPFTVDDPGHSNHKGYEYAAIVKVGNRTHYVSGENSPPGIVVEPHQP